MSETLVVRMPDAHRPAAWLVMDAFGNRMGQPGSGTLAEAAVLTSGRRVRACVPGADAILLHADLPTHNSRKIQQAVPFALEDKLAEDIENLHFAIGLRDARGYPTVVVTRARMQEWLAQLTAAGLAPAELVVDVLTLPVREHTLIVVPDEEQVLVRFPDGSGISAERALAPLLIQRQLATLPEAQRCTHALVYAHDESVQQAMATLIDGLELEITYSHLAAGAIGLMPGGPNAPQTINLLQGEFGRHSGAAEYWPRWRVAASLLVALIVIFVVQQISSEIRLRHEAATASKQIAVLFHSSMPDMKNVSDLGIMKSVMQQRLGQLTGGSATETGLLPMLATVGAALQAQSGTQLQGFSYHAGVLQLQVQAGSIDALDNLKSALAQDSAFHAQLDSVNSTSGQTTGRLTLRGSGS